MCVRGVDDGDRVDGEEKPAGKLNDGCRAHWGRVGEELGEEGVERGKRCGVGDEAGDLDDAGEAAPCILENGGEIGKGLACLHLKRIAGRGAGGRIDPGLPRGVHEIANTNRLRIGPDAGNARAIDDFRG